MTVFHLIHWIAMVFGVLTGANVDPSVKRTVTSGLRSLAAVHYF